MSDQGPAIADYAPIFEKHTITYSCAMAMRALRIPWLGLSEGVLTRVAMERVRRTLLTPGRCAIHLKGFSSLSNVMKCDVRES
jgi:hypothetical protein